MLSASDEHNVKEAAKSHSMAGKQEYRSAKRSRRLIRQPASSYLDTDWMHQE